MESVIAYIQENPGYWSLLIVCAAAALEYMVPPLPADTIVLAGSLLIVAGAWPFWVVASFVVVGGLIGSAVHYGLGRWMSDDDGSMRGAAWVEKLTGEGAIERFLSVVRRYGIWVIAINRMFPGLRGGVFLAAGAARLPVVPTLLLGLISNIAWSCAILGLGVFIGGNLEKLRSMLGVYQTTAAVVLVVACTIGYLVYRRRRQRKDA